MPWRAATEVEDPQPIDVGLEKVGSLYPNLAPDVLAFKQAALALRAVPSAEHLARMRDKVARADYAGQIADRLKIDSHIVREELKRTAANRQPAMDAKRVRAAGVSHGLLYVRGRDRLVCFELIPDKK